MWFMPIADHGNPRARHHPSIRGTRSFCSSLENVRMLDAAGSQPVSRSSSHREATLGASGSPRVHDYISPSRESVTWQGGGGGNNPADRGTPTPTTTPTPAVGRQPESEKRLLRQSRSDRSCHREMETRGAPVKDPSCAGLTGEVTLEVGRVSSSAASGPGESRRRKIVFSVVLVASALLLAAIAIMVFTVQMTPSVEEKLRKEQEQLMRKTNQGYVYVANGTDPYGAVIGDAFSSSSTTTSSSAITTLPTSGAVVTSTTPSSVTSPPEG